MFRTFGMTWLCLLALSAICVATLAAGEKTTRAAPAEATAEDSAGTEENAVKQPPTVWSSRALTGKAKGAWLSLMKVWKKEHYRFTPTVRAAYVKFARAQTLADLAAAKKRLPQDFLDWVDRDAVVAATVYGARLAPAKVLLMLYSLELDLGKKAVRGRYTQLALATAVVHAKEGLQADISPHDPLELSIPSCPLHPVDTKNKHRRLDVNDHIINFLADHVPVAEQVAPDVKMQGLREVYSAEKKKHPLVAADVLASKALQQEFNDYMRSKGQAVSIDCGDHVIYPDLHDMLVDKTQQDAIRKAYELFRGAYEAKGLLPAKRDKAPTPAEACAFLIRNDKTRLPPLAKRVWPQFPLNAPWPLLTLLAADDQPLREREDIWTRFRDTGEFHTYGEYIGSIAQQFDFQSARRLCPYPFTYGTYQMMIKDGGVCGTMANIAVRSYESLGVPACTAGQPGHCALIAFRLDSKTNTWVVKGEQYATGGDDKTYPHALWFFGDVDAKKDMVYHQSIAWAVNFGLLPYLHSTMAYDFLRLLPEADRQAHGQELVESALLVNPYNFLLVDAGAAVAPTLEAKQHVLQAFKKALAAAANTPGGPSSTLYVETVEANLLKNAVKPLVSAAGKTTAG